MDFNIDVRRKQLKSLDQFIQSTHNSINSILKSLDWDAEKVLEEDTLVPCTLNPEHKVPANKIVEHIKKCSIRSEKYPENEVYLSEPLHHPDASIHLSKEQKEKILSGIDSKFKTAWKSDNSEPKTCDRIYSTYNPQERLLLYNYCASKTKGPPELPEFNIYSNEPNSKELTRDEQLARHRDLKRRRMKYKKTFTSHKPPIEIMREVISGQMEMYEEWLKMGEEDRETSEENKESGQEGDKSNNEQIEYKNGEKSGQKVEESDNNCENSNRGYLEEESFDRSEISSRNSSSSKNNHRRSDKPRDRSKSHETSFSDRRRRRSRSHHGNNDDNGSHSNRRHSSNTRHSRDRRQTSDRRGDHNNGNYGDRRSRSRHNNSKRRRNGGRSRSTSRSKPYNSRHSNGNGNNSHRTSTSHRK